MFKHFFLFTISLFSQPLINLMFSRRHPVLWCSLSLSKPAGHVMHHQFNIQQLYALPTLYLCVLYFSEYKQRRVPLTA